MSNDKPAAVQPKSPASRPEAIAIKRVRFDGEMDIPGSQLSNISLTGRNPSEQRPGTGHHDIELQPWLRRFRIAYTASNKTEPPKVVYVHERFVRGYEEW